MKLQSLEIDSFPKMANLPEASIIEKMVIGSIINNGTEIFEEVSEILKSSMFYDDMHKHIFRIFEDMYRKGKPIGLLYLNQELKERGEDSVYTPGLIYSLSSEELGTAHLKQQCRAIAEKFILRRILNGFSDIQRDIYGNASLDSVLDKFGLLDDEISNFFVGDEKGYTMPELLKETLKLQDAKIAMYRSGKHPGITTGFRALDNRIGGFMPGTLNILGGRPGSGKTRLVIHFAEIASKNNFPVLFFSYEMLAPELGEILLGRNSGVNTVKLRDGKITDEELSIIHSKAIPKLERLNLTVYEGAKTINQVEKIIKKQVKRYGTCLVIIDYLQISAIPTEEKKIIREQQVSAISRNLKKIANDNKIPVIALSQLNRESEKNKEEPTLKDLRESGAIEQDADNVMLLYKPSDVGISVMIDGIEPERLLKIKVVKNRHGEKGEVDILLNEQYTEFLEPYN